MIDRRTFLAGTAATAAACGGSTPATEATPKPRPEAAPPPRPCPEPAAAGASGDITAATFAEAEKLAAVAYTAKERAQLLETVGDHLDRIRALRAVDLGFDVAPGVTFDPRPPGFAMPASKRSVRPARASAGKLPSSDADIAYAPVTQLAAWLAANKITSTRLTELYLARLEEHGPALECVATLTKDLALEQAARADATRKRGKAHGPLHGIPYGAKDLLDTKDIATGWGAAPYRDRVAAANAAVVQRLHDAGAVLVAKLTLGALAYGDIWYGGKTRNPWNPDEGSSGSSAGSAAATAAGLVGFAIGSETYGSIVSPSVRCGTTGLRPSFGRVARTGAMPLCWSLDKLGPLTRTVEDAVLVLSVIDGADPGDPSSIDAGLAYSGRRSVKGRTVGYDPRWFEGDDATDVDRAALEAAKRAGLTLTEIAMPDLPYDSLLPILLAEAAATFEQLTLTDRDDELTWQDKEAWPNTFREARFISAVDLVQAERLRRVVMQRFDAMFADVDAILSPAFSPMLLATNLTGHPGVVLRAGFETRDDHRVPRGITLYGKLYADGPLCEIARALEAELSVWSERPPGLG